jgi:phospho-N-acetylmuramoyl-pentapeptide-transferase
MLDHPFGTFWIAFAISAILGWPMLLLMRVVKGHAAISQYTPEHAGKVGTPSMGGIAPIMALLVVLFYLLLSSPAAETTRVLIAMIIGIAGFATIGLMDDFVIPRLMPGKRGFGWTQKLIAQLVLVAAIVLALQPLTLMESVIYGFMVIFFANAVNFSDGLDGLCGGLLILAMLAFTRGALGGVAMAVIGSLIPFMFLNAPPAKIFMGDVGALPFGAVFGVLVAHQLLNPIQVPQWMMAASLIVISLIFILELVLVPLQLFWVKVFKKRLIPASPVHHSFEKMGWPETRITATFLLTQLLLTILGLSLINEVWL